MSNIRRRALHFVFKVGDRTRTADFYRQLLGMTVLRHEEFDAGCKATCNGPYDGRWSKTMMGYGPEDNHFVVELTYNYGVSDYVLGNDFLGITVESSETLDRARLNPDGDCAIERDVVMAPGGYAFRIVDQSQPKHRDPVVKVSLASSNLQRSIDYWTKIVGLKLYSPGVETPPSKATLGFADDQCKLELCDIGTAVDHGTAFGRIAFACPTAELVDIERKANESSDKGRVITPLVALDTPGKATVSVVILADPDGHEICFVGDEGFRQLSQVDPLGDQLLTNAIKADKSDEWFAVKGQKKAKA